MLPIRLAITSGVRERLRTKTARDFLLEGLRQVTLEGNGAEFILLGQATNIALLNCTDVVIRNLRITSFSAGYA